MIGGWRGNTDNAKGAANGTKCSKAFLEEEMGENRAYDNGECPHGCLHARVKFQVDKAWTSTHDNDGFNKAKDI